MYTSSAPTIAACQMMMNSGLIDVWARSWPPPEKATCAMSAIATPPISRPPSLPSRWRQMVATIIPVALP